MLPAVRLAAALGRLPGRALEGVLYRAIDLEALYGFHRDPPHPAPRPLYSLGPARSGARYTPRGGPPALYFAEDASTAYAEAGIGGPWRPPTVIVTARTRLASVLDVAHKSVQAALGTSLAELVKPWRLAAARGQRPATHALGQAVFDNGRFQGIRYPSAKALGHRCVLVFPDRLAPPSFVQVHDPLGNLPQRIPPRA